MKVNYGKEFEKHRQYTSYNGYKNNESSKTGKIVGLFMAAVLAVSTGCYLTAPARQDDQEDKKDQSSHSSGGGYYNYSSSKNGQISEGVAPARGGIGSGATGGAE